MSAKTNSEKIDAIYDRLQKASIERDEFKIKLTELQCDTIMQRDNLKSFRINNESNFKEIKKHLYHIDEIIYQMGVRSCEVSDDGSNTTMQTLNLKQAIDSLKKKIKKLKKEDK